MALNRGCVYREQVGPASAGVTVLDHLVAAHRHSTRATWTERIERGEVVLDDGPARADAVLWAGRDIVWHRPPWDEPDVPLHFEVIREDAAILAVNKPSGLPTLPAGGFLEHTLLTLVQAQYPAARPMHRLGRHTSGIVVFGRTHAAAAALGRDWREHRVDKRYRALGRGAASWDRLEIAAAIGPVSHPTLGTVHAASADGKASHSVATVIERRADSTLFHVDIATGRPHQIRIHLAWAGHPLLGDPLYDMGGVPRAENPGLPGDGGYLLLAERVRFQHPSTRDAVVLHAPVPPDLTARDE